MQQKSWFERGSGAGGNGHSAGDGGEKLGAAAQPEAVCSALQTPAVSSARGEPQDPTVTTMQEGNTQHSPGAAACILPCPLARG